MRTTAEFESLAIHQQPYLHNSVVRDRMKFQVRHQIQIAVVMVREKREWIYVRVSGKSLLTE